ncbi:MAG TPA: hypothetical protein VLZ33_05115 [Dysgonamonadaceae bacterium]|nr:hypothetical protein [Dysgonamonadaceae bacterium]
MYKKHFIKKTVSDYAYLFKSLFIFVEEYFLQKLLVSMSLQCPLCGNSKADKSLFCIDCTVKLNSEYEVSIPTLGNSKKNTASKPENGLEKEKESISEAPRTTIDADNRAKRNILGDNRTDSQKSYYEIERDKSPKRTRFIVVSIFILVLVLVASYYIYNQHVKDKNLERSVWEFVQRENSVDSYLDYIDQYPQGTYAVEAQSRMRSLKSNESEAWENLRASENTTEFTDFLETYPNSPYERMVKNRLDSLLWEATLKENSSQAYSDYINMSSLDEITGQYIGEAQKRYKMLYQTTPVVESELESIKETVNGFFTGLSNVSHTELSNYLAETISRFNYSTNVSREGMIGQLLLLAAKSDAKSINFDPDIAQLRYEKMGNDTYNIDVPLQKYFVDNNDGTNQIKGYIVHLKLDANFKIYSFYETKPFSTAP